MKRLQFARRKRLIYLSFGEVEILGQLLALGSDDVVILFERVFQLEQLAGREGRPHALRLAERRQEESGQITWTLIIRKRNGRHV